MQVFAVQYLFVFLYQHVFQRMIWHYKVIDLFWRSEDLVQMRIELRSGCTDDYRIIYHGWKSFYQVYRCISESTFELALKARKICLPWPGFEHLNSTFQYTLAIWLSHTLNTAAASELYCASSQQQSVFKVISPLLHSLEPVWFSAAMQILLSEAGSSEPVFRARLGFLEPYPLFRARPVVLIMLNVIEFKKITEMMCGLY